jgi:hypothetical protein
LIEAGYEAVAFSQFLTGKRENGDDIDMWRLDELKGQVKEYLTGLEKPRALSIFSKQVSAPVSQPGGYEDDEVDDSIM